MLEQFVVNTIFRHPSTFIETGARFSAKHCKTQQLLCQRICFAPRLLQEFSLANPEIRVCDVVIVK